MVMRMHAACCAAWGLLLGGCYGGDPYSMQVTQAEYGESWPFHTPDARIGCDQDDVAYLTVDGKRYALNVRAEKAGLPSPESILRPHTGPPLVDFLERATSLCQTRAQVSVDPSSKSDLAPPKDAGAQSR